jgi:hypothetical protein
MRMPEIALTSHDENTNLLLTVHDSREFIAFRVFSTHFITLQKLDELKLRKVAVESDDSASWFHDRTFVSTCLRATNSSIVAVRDSTTTSYG